MPAEPRLPAVLVVDDEDALRSILAEILRALPCDVHEASDGLSALQKVKARRFDAVLVDLKMPKLSGLDFLDMARMYGFAGPVIVITGHGTKQQVIEAVRLGVADFIEKPFEIETVLAAVRRAVELKDRKVG